MGITSCPRPIYENGVLIIFFVKSKIINYVCTLWNDDGLKNYEFSKGVYQDNSKDIIKLARETINLDITKAGNDSIFWMTEKESQQFGTVSMN